MLFKNGVLELKQVIQNVRMLGVPEENFKIELSIARGLDYYTGTVYETFLNEYRSLGSICSGGRYDNLAEYYTDKKLPGVGVSIGITRLFYQLNELKALGKYKENIADVLIIPMTDDYNKCLEIATKLRKNGISTQVYFEDKKIKAKFKYADKLKIKNVIVIGEEEIEKDLVTLKNMETGEQQTITVEEAIKQIK